MIACLLACPAAKLVACPTSENPGDRTQTAVVAAQIQSTSVGLAAQGAAVPQSRVCAATTMVVAAALHWVAVVVDRAY